MTTHSFLRFVLILFLLTGWVGRHDAHAQRDPAGLVPPGYYTCDEIYALADSLADHFPSICRKETYGTSLGGRPLVALKISDNADADEAEPEILFDGGCHGDEIGGAENLIRFARDLCLGYGTDSVITNLVNSRELWLFLMVNPDGRVSMSRFNGAMVDLNRDYGYMWDASGGSTSAFSQPESRAVRDCILAHRFSLYLSYHSGMEQAAYPWAYRGDEPRDRINLRRVAKAYSDSSQYPALPFGQSYSIMYQSNGMSVDYFYGTQGQVCFTMEISNNKQPPNPMDYYSANYPAMLEMMRIAGSGISGFVTDSATGQPLDALVWIDDFFPAGTSPINGDFCKYAVPGTHTVRVTANGYAPAEGILVYVPPAGSASIQVALSQGPGHYAGRVSSCRIPGNNPADEGYTPGSIGRPDSIAYSLGKNGWIVLDLGDSVVNGDGNELSVTEAGNSDEGYSCFAGNSPDGPWTNLGSAFGTSAFDLGSLVSARYVKILDDGDGEANEPYAGFDLDAIQVIPDPWTSLQADHRPMAVNAFPNPSTGVFSIRIPGQTEGSITVTDLSGRIVHTEAAAVFPVRLDLSGLDSGVYCCVIRTPSSSASFLLVKL